MNFLDTKIVSNNSYKDYSEGQILENQQVLKSTFTLNPTQTRIWTLSPTLTGNSVLTLIITCNLKSDLRHNMEINERYSSL